MAAKKTTGKADGDASASYKVLSFFLILAAIVTGCIVFPGQ